MGHLDYFFFLSRFVARALIGRLCRSMHALHVTAFITRLVFALFYLKISNTFITQVASHETDTETAPLSAKILISAVRLSADSPCAGSSLSVSAESTIRPCL